MNVIVFYLHIIVIFTKNEHVKMHFYFSAILHNGNILNLLFFIERLRASGSSNSGSGVSL